MHHSASSKYMKLYIILQSFSAQKVFRVVSDLNCYIVFYILKNKCNLELQKTDKQNEKKNKVVQIGI